MTVRLVALLALALLGAPGAAAAQPDLALRLILGAPDKHVGAGIDLTVQVINRGSADVANVRWTATFSSNLNPSNSRTAGNIGPIAPGQRLFDSAGAVIVHRGVATIRVAVHADGFDEVATAHFTALPPSRAFVELRDPAPAPGGTRVAFVRWTSYGRRSAYPGPTTFGRIYVTNGSTATAVTPTQSVPTGLAWAPDGHAVAYASGGHIWTIDLRTHALRRLTSAGTGDERWPVWSPDGTRIAYTTGNRFGLEVAATVPATGGVAPTTVAYTAAQVGWSPDGAHVVAGGSLWDANGDLQSTFTGDVEWSRDGAWILRRAQSSNLLTVVSAQTGELVASLPARPLPVHPHLSPHADTVAAATVTGRVVLTDVASGKQHFAPRAASSFDSARWTAVGLAAYVGSGRCGPRSEIDTVKRDGTDFRTIAKACST